MRFVRDPLASVSEQFPLGPSGFAAPEHSDSPSCPDTRPWGLRWLTEMGVPAEPASYRYCPVRQVAVDVVTDQPVAPLSKLEWTTVANKDGDDGGPSKDYAWEVLPDFTG
uniref:putative ATP-grasp-modified RiPP n=1 Tax=Amycolatopsis sp. CA-096443 TaxID=3239919 RepID=UPI003F495BA5